MATKTVYIVTSPENKSYSFTNFSSMTRHLMSRLCYDRVVTVERKNFLI